LFSSASSSETMKIEDRMDDTEYTDLHRSVNLRKSASCVLFFEEFQNHLVKWNFMTNQKLAVNDKA